MYRPIVEVDIEKGMEEEDPHIVELGPAQHPDYSLSLVATIAGLASSQFGFRGSG